MRKKLEKSFLEELGPNGKKPHYLSLLNDYLNLWDISQDLSQDIKDRGVTIEWRNSETSFGTKDNPRSEEHNPSISNLLKTNAQMLSIKESLEKGFVNPPKNKSEVEVKKVKKFGSEVNV